MYPLKCTIIEFGNQFFDNSEFYLKNRIILKVDMLKYLFWVKTLWNFTISTIFHL